MVGIRCPDNSSSFWPDFVEKSQRGKFADSVLSRVLGEFFPISALAPQDLKKGNSATYSKTQVEFSGALNSHNLRVFEIKVFFENSPLKIQNSSVALYSHRPVLCRLFWKFLQNQTREPVDS